MSSPHGSERPPTTQSGSPAGQTVTHVLFDFFGTLVTYSDSRVTQGYPRSHDVLLTEGARVTYAGFLAQWEETCAQFEARAQRDLVEYSMDAVCDAFLRLVLPRAPDLDVVGRFRDCYLGEWNKGVRYIPSLAGLLDDLSQRFALAVVTNTHHADLIHRHLEAMNVGHYFRAVVTSIEHGKRKPSRCIFDRALEATAGTPEQSVYVGDSYPADYVGAVQAGLRCLLIDPQSQSDVPARDRLSDVLETGEGLLRQ
jgi:putative hydrolase of the HAD superfamily